MSNDIICTQLELKTYAWNEDNPTAFNLDQFIKSKNGKYTLIELEFIKDCLQFLDKYLANNKILIMDIETANNEFKKKWNDIIKML